MPVPESYQSDHLLLLVGGNPLPNAVAARLLAKSGATISLLHSNLLKSVAQRLQNWLSSNRFDKNKIRLAEVGEVDPQSIAREVRKEMQAVESTRLGVHYTGGTKAMVAHAYRMALEEKRKPVCFSYLDARGLQMIFDPKDPLHERPYFEPVGLDPQAKMSLQDLLDLHGWTFQKDPKIEPILPKSAQALAGVYGNCHGEKWEWWLVKSLHPQAKRPKESLETAFLCPQAPDNQICYEVKRWQSKSNLKKIKPGWPSDPELISLVQSLKSELKIDDESTLEAPAKAQFNNNPQALCEWLEGEWLESWTLQALKGQEVALNLHDVKMDLNMELENGENVKFQLDVIAVRGYRLFAFSCSTDHKQRMLKLKLFEAYQRARQLGGDEARVALVCSSDDPLGVERQARHDLDAQTGRIRVFGRCHLIKLSEHLSEWMKQESLN